MKPVTRIQENLLAKQERRLLNWLCARMPAWIKPDMLTALGFFGALTSAAGYVLSNRNPAWLYLSIVGYFINWFGDSLDGSLARFRKAERPTYGYFIDHSTDSLANTLLAIGFGLSPYVDLRIALFTLAGYLLLSIHTFVAARVVEEFRLSYLSAGPTELRLILIAVTLGMLAFGPRTMALAPLSGTPLSLFDILLGGLGICLIILYIIQTISTARQLLAREKHR